MTKLTWEKIDQMGGPHAFPYYDVAIPGDGRTHRLLWWLLEGGEPHPDGPTRIGVFFSPKVAMTMLRRAREVPDAPTLRSWQFISWTDLRRHALPGVSGKPLIFGFDDIDQHLRRDVLHQRGLVGIVTGAGRIWTPPSRDQIADDLSLNPTHQGETP